MSTSGAADATTDAMGYARLLLGWLLAIVLISVIVRTRWGYVLVYYTLVLVIIMLVLGSSQRVTDLLGLVRAPGPSSQGPSGG